MSFFEIYTLKKLVLKSRQLQIWYNTNKRHPILPYFFFKFSWTPVLLPHVVTSCWGEFCAFDIVKKCVSACEFSCGGVRRAGVVLARQMHVRRPCDKARAMQIGAFITRRTGCILPARDHTVRAKLWVRARLCAGRQANFLPPPQTHSRILCALW